MDEVSALKKQRMTSTQMFASFRLGTTELAVSISSLQEVVNFPDKVSRVPLAPEYLTGLFNLRGLVAPIVDMAKLLDLPTSEVQENKKVAIVNIDKVRIGLLFDATSEMLNVSEENISWMDERIEGSKSVVRGVLKLNGGDRIIEIIDPALLIQIENIPQILEQAKTSVQTETAKKKSRRAQCITFKSGSLEFGLKIAGISEIIKVPEIKRSVLAVDYCIGMVNLRGSIIPILDFQMFLKLPKADIGAELDERRIVILKLEKIQVGFLVDSVDSIVAFFEEDILPVPMFKQEKVEMMQGLLCPQPDLHILLLKETKILSDQEIVAITKGHQTLYGKKDEDKEAHQKRASDRKPYLSFKLKHMLSTRLGAVDEIAKYTDDMVCPPGYPEYVAGMMNMRGEVVMVVDLRVFYGMTALTDRSQSRILVIKGEKAKYGLLVDEVDAINTLDEGMKLRIPAVLTPQANKDLQGDIKEVVEMNDALGNKRTLMIFEVAEFIKKIEAQAAGIPAAS
ncbi:chemotaxis protein CheW [Bdellovibrio bacteriovorus]|nr:chemotaxis protein CheW [Bdellovibrio bacteriovorus]